MQPPNYVIQQPNIAGALSSGFDAFSKMRALKQSEALNQKKMQHYDMQIEQLELQKREKVVKELEYKRDFEQLMKNPTPEAISSFMLKYPDKYKAAEAATKQMDKGAKETAINEGGALYSALNSGNKELALKMVNQKITAAENSGLPTEQYEQTKNYIETDIANGTNIAAAVTGGRLIGIMGADAFKQAFPADKGKYHLLTTQEKKTLNLDPSIPIQISPDGKYSQVGGGAVEVNIDSGQKKLGEEVAKQYAKVLGTSIDSASKLSNTASEIKQINTYLQNYDGSVWDVARAELGKYLPEDSEWRQYTTADQAAQAIRTKLATTVRAAGSGSTSDMEMKMYLEAIPSMITTKEGRALMSKYADVVARRANIKLDAMENIIDRGETPTRARLLEEMKTMGVEDEFFTKEDKQRIQTLVGANKDMSNFVVGKIYRQNGRNYRYDGKNFIEVK